MEMLLQAMVKYGVKAVILAVVLVIGVNLGKFLRIRKDAKKDSDN